MDQEEKDRLIFSAKEAAGGVLTCGIRAETFARFWVERFGEHPQDMYFQEWVERFAQGSEWWHMDVKSQIAYLVVLRSSWKGTAAAIHVIEVKT